MGDNIRIPTEQVGVVEIGVISRITKLSKGHSRAKVLFAFRNGYVVQGRKSHGICALYLQRSVRYYLA